MTVLPEFALSEAKAREGGMAAERLNDIMRESARQHGWTFVDAHRSRLPRPRHVRRLSDAPWTMADELRLPRKIDGVWEPYKPSEWRAYASRQRWFRTPNDAFMTGNFHVSQSLLQKRAEDAGLLLGPAACWQASTRAPSIPPPRARRRSPMRWSRRPAPCSPSTRAGRARAKRVDLGSR